MSRSLRGALGAILVALLGSGCTRETLRRYELSEGASTVVACEVLFDGTSLDGWKATEFGGAGELALENGALVLELGNPLTGITWTGRELRREDYALSVRATKLAGHDFFCGLTFPIGAECASLILGGWGGTTCGLSCIDGRDASENETTSYRRFENDREVAIRIEVSSREVRAFLDGEPLFTVARAGKRFAVRGEVVASQPLGYCAFATRAALRAIEQAPLPPRASATP